MCFAISVTIRGEIVSWLPGSRSASPLNLRTIRLYLGCPATDSRFDMKTDNGLGETPVEVKRLHVWGINPGFGRKTHTKGTKVTKEK